MTFLDTIVAAAVLWCAYKGWNYGVQDTTIEALELIGCMTLAVLLHETVAGYLHMLLAAVFGDSISQGWAMLIAFASLAWGSLVVIRRKFHGEGGSGGEGEEPDMDPLMDRIGGVIGGAIGGVMLVGGVLMTISMVPFLAWIKPSGDTMAFDAGKMMLTAAGQFVTDRHEGVPLPIWGEPASARSDTRALLTSEPWFDVDGDGAATEADPFREIDDSGGFSKELYYVDVDRDGSRRIGLIDKYMVGRWDIELRSDEQKRTDLKKAPPKGKTKGEPDPKVDTAPVDDF